MCYRDSRGVVPPAGIRHGRMIVNSAGDYATWPCRCVCVYIGVAEPPYERHPLPRQMALGNIVNVIQVCQPRKYMTCQLIIGQLRHRMLSGGAVRRNSLRSAPFGPPTVSCVLAPARTCLRQAPPTSRGRGLATSAVSHHLADDTSIKAFTRGKRCKKTSFFTPFLKFCTNCVKTGLFLYRWFATRL